MTDVEEILNDIVLGKPLAAEKLLPLVYDELRRLAAHNLSQEKPGQTLNATALVNEAYLRLIGPGDATRWDNGGHFFAAAAIAMRRILVEQARRKHRIKRGGGRQRVDLVEPPAPSPNDELLALDEALTRLAQDNALAAQVVELRHFAGLSHEAVAKTLSITVYQTRQKWDYARAWLRDALEK